MADKPYKSKSNKEDKKVKQTVKQNVKHEEDPVKKDSGEIQVHFGNYKKIEIALLNAMNRNIYSVLELLKRLEKQFKEDK